jgi:hypothetical protein
MGRLPYGAPTRYIETGDRSVIWTKMCYIDAYIYGNRMIDLGPANKKDTFPRMFVYTEIPCKSRRRLVH